MVALRPAPGAHAATQVNNAPFEASFQNHVVSVTTQTGPGPCPGPSGSLCITFAGDGTANYLGQATVVTYVTPTFSDNPCVSLAQLATLTADDGSGSLSVAGTGQNCPAGNSPPTSHSNGVITYTWTITGGTGRFCGASGDGTEQGVHDGPTRVEVHYSGTITLPDSC
jgi:hypothetical protein